MWVSKVLLHMILLKLADLGARVQRSDQLDILLFLVFHFLERLIHVSLTPWWLGVGKDYCEVSKAQ